MPNYFNRNEVHQPVKGVSGETYYIGRKSIRYISEELAEPLPKGVMVVRVPKESDADKDSK